MIPSPKKVSRRNALKLFGATGLGFWATAHAEEATVAMSPEEALTRLKLGNEAYVSNLAAHPGQTAAVRETVAKGQTPFAIVLGCADSRVPPEIVFDQGLGDLFTVRVAGNIADDAVLGSIQFAAAEFGVPLIMVLGHERCGAVKATLEYLEAENKTELPGAIASLVEPIAPAVERVLGSEGDVLQNAVHSNVELVVETLQADAILQSLIAENKLMIVGGSYDLDTGIVAMLPAMS
jgi:carbonic anhydrase